MVVQDDRTTTLNGDEKQQSGALGAEELRRMNAYWRACNYLSAGMIYLRANPLLREPLKPEHIKNRLLGHWGRRPPAPSMRAASLATASAMPLVQRSTTLTSSLPA